MVLSLRSSMYDGETESCRDVADLSIHLYRIVEVSPHFVTTIPLHSCLLTKTFDSRRLVKGQSIVVFSSGTNKRQPSILHLHPTKNPSQIQKTCLNPPPPPQTEATTLGRPHLPRARSPSSSRLIMLLGATRLLLLKNSLRRFQWFPVVRRTIMHMIVHNSLALEVVLLLED